MTILYFCTTILNQLDFWNKKFNETYKDRQFESNNFYRLTKLSELLLLLKLKSY